MGNPPITGIAGGQIDPVLLQQYLQANQATTAAGATQVGPQVPQHQVEQPNPMPRREMQPIRPVGPGQGGARKAIEQQNFAASISNTVGNIVDAYKQRKARDDQKVFDAFTQNYKGLQDAKAQSDEAAKAMDAAKKSGDQQAYLEAAQRLQTAQTALKTSRQNLDDLTSDPKKRKLLAKGYGIDDKNAGTPERQQAIASLKKQLGVGGSTADMLSRMPQGQQLTPQAQGQAMARQAGVVGAPATQGQVLTAATKQDQLNQKMQQAAADRKAHFMQEIPKLQQAGYTIEKDAAGQPLFDSMGYPVIRQMSKEEADANPELSIKNEQLRANIDFLKARTAVLTDPNNQQYKINLLRAQAAMKNANAIAGGDSKTVAQGIEEGNLPPEVLRLYRMAGPVEAQLARDGFNMAQAQLDWKATEQYVKSLNSQQQLRLKQAVEFVYQSTPNVDNLYDQWVKTGLPTGFKIYNRAALNAAKNLPGEQGKAAALLDQQVADLVSELATVYKGGNSSTDHTLELAAQNLKGEWNPETFKGALDQIQKTMRYRKNSMNLVGVAGVSPDSMYGHQGGTAAPEEDVIVVNPGDMN